ncbi:MAG: hypothetical protein WAT19_07655 [Ferruginibacter sp.]
MKNIFLSIFLSLGLQHAEAQEIQGLLAKIKAKLDLVNDYEASGTMKTNVSFLKVPVAQVKIFYKKPDKIRIKSNKGVSFVPKGAVSLNLNQLLMTNNYSILDAGTEVAAGRTLRVAKLLPNDENSEVVLSTIYIDAERLVIAKSRTTTRENGTYELEMSYGKFIQYALPDKIVFSFNTKDYKLPKGITFDFDNGTPAEDPAKKKNKNKKGRAEIVIRGYIINKGVADEAFK